MDFAYSISHYFFPGRSNNHKAKILHSSSLTFIALFLIAIQIVLQVLPLAGIRILGYGANISTTEVINLTNSKRAEFGLSDLQYNSLLAQAAKAKGEDMLTGDYWAHVSPDGIQPWRFFQVAGYNYRFAGENLARDFSDPSSAVEAWMASPSHKENILSSKYKEIGIAVVEGDLAGVETTIIVQLFGTSYVDTTPQVPIARAEEAPTPTPGPQPALEIAKEEELAPSEIVSTTQLVSGTTQKPKIIVSPFDTTRTVSFVVIVLLLSIMVVDGILVSRKKVVRVGGRTFAHLAFLGMILAVVIIAKAGRIL